MIRNLFSIILRARLEDVVAVGVSTCLLILVATTRLFHSFDLGMHDLLFVLLPVGALALKTFLGMLGRGEDNADAQVGPFQFIALSLRPLLKLMRDWFPFLLLS